MTDEWLDLEEGAWDSWKPQTREAGEAVKNHKWVMRHAHIAGFEAGWNRGKHDANKTQARLIDAAKAFLGRFRQCGSDEARELYAAIAAAVCEIGDPP